MITWLFEFMPASISQLRHPLTLEQNLNYVLSTFLGRRAMLKIMVQEAAALASLSLFVGMIAIWSQVFSNL
jgi:hypothetical protein